MMKDRVISDGGLKATPTGFDVDIRLPWYRSLPLSTVEVVELKFGGAPVPLDRISFEVNGKTFELDGLIELYDEWWYVLDSAYLHVHHAPIERGRDYEVEVTVRIFPPYIKGFTPMTRCLKTLRAN